MQMTGETAFYVAAVDPVGTVTTTTAGNASLAPRSTLAEPEDFTRPLILLDWDDTLLPNTHLAILKCSVDEQDDEHGLDQQIKADLAPLISQAESFIQACLSIGECYIVTNGEDGWVRRSCQRFMPQIWPLVERIPVISARSRYEQVLPRAPTQWKFAVFTELMHKHQCFTNRQVMCFGDSSAERDALLRISSQAGSAVKAKSVKFLENPSMTQMEKQLRLVGGFLSHLSSHPEPLDLVLTPSMVA